MRDTKSPFRTVADGDREIERLREALRSSRIAIVRDDSPAHAVEIINAALAASK